MVATSSRSHESGYILTASTSSAAAAAAVAAAAAAVAVAAVATVYALSFKIYTLLSIFLLKYFRKRND